LVKRGPKINIQLVAGVADCDQRRQHQHCPFAVIEHRATHEAAHAVLENEPGKARISLAKFFQCVAQRRPKRFGVVSCESHAGGRFHLLIACRAHKREQLAGIVASHFWRHFPRLRVMLFGSLVVGFRESLRELTRSHKICVHFMRSF
jgi:hypothetical protein